MQNQSTTGKSGNDFGSTKSDFGSAKDDLRSAKDNFSAGMKEEARSAQQTLNSAKEEVRRKAGEYASEAKTAAFQQAEGAQHDIGDKLAALGGALRAAGDRLAGDKQNTMSKLAEEAAGTIDQFSQTLKTKGFGEVVGDMRKTARQHPGMVFAGAMLAGIALGRLFKSTPPSDDAGSDYGRMGARGYGAGKGRNDGSGRRDTFASSSTAAADASFPSTPAPSGGSAGLNGSTGETKL